MKKRFIIVLINYIKLKDSTELPCLYCSKQKTNVFLVEDIDENKKKKSYMCEKYFKVFKTDLSKILS
jgi:hypothetical protein